MQGVGGKEDTELSREDLVLGQSELSVESLDAVSRLEVQAHLIQGKDRCLGSPLVMANDFDSTLSLSLSRSCLESIL